MKGVSYSFIVCKETYTASENLATGQQSLPVSTQNPFLALGQVLKMFTVCLYTVSAQQLGEGMVTILLSIAEVHPFNRGAMLITNSVGLGFVFLM